MHSWQLPDHISDILPTTARQLENAKEALLSLFKVHGYELVNPPLMEYTNSLLTKIDPGLSLKTMRVVDQISGYQLGLRADITPQISRIDAHLLANKNGVNRLCYAAPVLHAIPQTLRSSREPLQVGAELYGLESTDADIELIDLMLKSLKILKVNDPLLSLGHLGVFRAITQNGGIDEEKSQEILGHIQSKDLTEIEKISQKYQLDYKTVECLKHLCSLYGGAEVIDEARSKLPQLEPIEKALNELEVIVKRFENTSVHIDLSELRVDYYHTGLLFGFYAEGWSAAIMKGGRYNGLGKYFGRSRFATGFSFDLKEFIDILPKVSQSYGILAPKEALQNEHAQKLIDDLRLSGETVVIDYLDEGMNALSCNRVIQQKNDQQWIVV